MPLKRVTTIKETKLANSLVRDALAEVSKDGKFVRTAAGFRSIISRNHPIYQPEKGRYHLYISLACPWTNRCLTLLKLKGLENVISYTVVHPIERGVEESHRSRTVRH